MSEDQQLIADPVLPTVLEPGKVYNQPPRFMHQKYIDIDVVESARQRIRYVLDNFEHVSVSFSGGKDSLVVLTLVEQIYKERGRTDKVNVKFMDEELVCDAIIDFVQKQADTGRFNFRWYCLAMYVGFFVMGKHKPFVTWDKNRPWHRQPPDRDYVIYDIGVSTAEQNENSIGRYIYPVDGTKHMELVGVRADESMKRFLSVSKGYGDVPNYVSPEVPGHLWSCRPIYDWTELDIFKFLKDSGTQYCDFYDAQVWVKAPLRVASAMHERGISQFMKLKQMAPKFYEQLRATYPEIETHYRYMNEIVQGEDVQGYAHTFDGVRSYIEDRIDASHKKEALAFVNTYETKRRTQLSKDPNQPLGRVSIRQLFNLIIGGKFVKGAALHHTISQADIDYEQPDS